MKAVNPLPKTHTPQTQVQTLPKNHTLTHTRPQPCTARLFAVNAPAPFYYCIPLAQK